MAIAMLQPRLRMAFARSSMYKLLAKSFLYPAEEVIALICKPCQKDVLSDYLTFADHAREMRESVLAYGELLCPKTGVQAREELEREYNRLFAHLGSAKCPPYETEYGYDNIFQKTTAMADIAGFYRAYELEVADTNTERVDFLSTELEFMSYLALKEAYARELGEQEHLGICMDTQRKFLQDHLGRWISIFTEVLGKSTENQFYLHLGKLTEQFLESEVLSLGVMPTKVTAPVAEREKIPAAFSCDACISRPPLNS